MEYGLLRAATQRQKIGSLSKERLRWVIACQVVVARRIPMSWLFLNTNENFLLCAATTVPPLPIIPPLLLPPPLLPPPPPPPPPLLPLRSLFPAIVPI